MPLNMLGDTMVKKKEADRGKCALLDEVRESQHSLRDLERLGSK